MKVLNFPPAQRVQVALAAHEVHGADQRVADERLLELWNVYATAAEAVRCLGMSEGLADMLLHHFQVAELLLELIGRRAQDALAGSPGPGAGAS